MRQREHTEKQAPIVCRGCAEKDLEIARLKEQLERYANVTPVTPTVTRTNAERQRAYRDKKRAHGKDS